MNKKRIWWLVPTITLPYLLLLTLCIILFSTDQSIFKFIMENIFQNNAWILLATFTLYCIIASTLSIICFILSIVKKWDALTLAKTSMIIKLIQVPAYIMIFIFGFIMLITIFTIPFSFVLFIFDCWILFLTSLITLSGVLNSIYEKKLKFSEIIWVIILQFIFCVDVVSSIIFYKKLKNKSK